MNVDHGPTHYWAEFIGRLINLIEWCNTLGPINMSKFDQLSVSPTLLAGFLFEVTLSSCSDDEATAPFFFFF